MRAAVAAERFDHEGALLRHDDGGLHQDDDDQHENGSTTYMVVLTKTSVAQNCPISIVFCAKGASSSRAHHQDQTIDARDDGLATGLDRPLIDIARSPEEP